MLDLSDLSNEIKKIQESICPCEIYDLEPGHGLETEPHITVLYGLHVQQAKSIVNKIDLRPVSFKIKNISLFENDKFDVLKFGIESKDLHELNKEVCENFERFSAANYSVAWVDALASGKDFGRSILYIGNHSDDKDFSMKKFKSLNLPMKLGSFIINKYTMNIFNKIYYKKNSINNQNKNLIDFNNFFYPLDKIKNWNLVYGNGGFIQYQFVIPKENSVFNLKKILKTINNHNEFSSLAVLKLLGKNNNNYLSFPMEGLTMALDFKLSNSIMKLIKFLDGMILDMNGKIYLAKDALMSENIFKKTYPKWQEFQAVRQKYKADGKFVSNQSKRLGLS
jgi:hypothetical protein